MFVRVADEISLAQPTQQMLRAKVAAGGLRRQAVTFGF